MSAPEPPKRGINRNDCPMSQSPNSYLTASSQLLNALVHYVPGHPNFRSQKSQSSKTYFISCQTITNCRNLYTTNPHHTELPKHTANSAQTAIPTSISHNTAKLHVSISQSIRQPKSDVSNVPGPNQSSYHHWWISSKVSTKTTVLCLKVPTHIQQLQLNFLTSPCPMSQTSQVIKTHQFIPKQSPIIAFSILQIQNSPNFQNILPIQYNQPASHKLTKLHVPNVSNPSLLVVDYVLRHGESAKWKKFGKR
jgi:hypothetical protein